MKKIFILVTGNSSSGKSLIVNNLCNHNFLCFALDSYMSVESFDKLFKNIKNNYGESRKYFTIESVKKMVDQAIASNKNVIFDTVEQKKNY
jgi:dephospho-CoA kinase